MKHRPVVLALGMAGLLAALPVAGQRTETPASMAPPAAEPLTLAEVYALAQARNPRLHAAAAVAAAAEAREPAAGLLPDPMLQLGIMNVSVPGLNADMPASMAPSIQAMQMVPLFGKLDASARIAEQSTAMARADADESWWQVRAEVAAAFYTIHETDAQLAVMRETVHLLENFERVAKAMYGAGEGRQSDILRAGVEVARMDAEIRRMEAMRATAVARLNGLLARPVATPVPAVAPPPIPSTVPSIERLSQWAGESRPMLARERTGVERAATQRELARKEIWPDPVIGVQYGQRADAMGVERMGSAMVGFSVPLFAGKRQLRMRDEAAAMEAMARAELADARAQVDARIGELVAELEQTTTLVVLYEADVLPQAHANVQSALSSYRVGAVDFMTLVDAQMDANRYEQELHALRAEHGRAVAELESTIGRALPAPAATIVEAR